MQTHFRPACLPDGELPVIVHTAGLTSIILGAVELYVQGPDDADLLIKAAAKAKHGMEMKAREAALKQETDAPAMRVLESGRILAPGEPVRDDWCPATTDMEDFGATLYCDRENGHPGSHHAPGPDEGSEVAWSDEPAEPEALIPCCECCTPHCPARETGHRTECDHCAAGLPVTEPASVTA